MLRQDHIAAIRISHRHRTQLPLIFLQRKLGRAILTDRAVPTEALAEQAEEQDTAETDEATTERSAALGRRSNSAERSTRVGSDVLSRWTFKPKIYRWCVCGCLRLALPACLSACLSADQLI